MDPDYFDVSTADIAQVNNDMLFYVFPFQMTYTVLSGFIYDIFGRKPTLICNLLATILCAFVSPSTAPDLYPWYFIVRIGAICSLSAVIANPLILDYIKKSSRGKAYAI